LKVSKSERAKRLAVVQSGKLH